MYNEKPSKAITAGELLKKQFPKQRSYIDPMLLTKGGTLLLGGEAKAGKSFLMLEATRALTTATPFMDNSFFQVPEPVRVLYIEQENGEPTIQARIETLFAKEKDQRWRDNLTVISQDFDIHFDGKAGIDRLVREIELAQPNVLILDPINMLFHRDENSNTEVGILFYKLWKIKEQFKESLNLSMIFSHHFGKRPWGKYAEGWDALSEYNFRGASKWKDGGDSLITIQRGKLLREDPESWEFMARFLTRHGSSPPQGEYTFNEKEDLRIIHKYQAPKQLAPLKKVYTPDPAVQGLLELAAAEKAKKK